VGAQVAADLHDPLLTLPPLDHLAILCEACCSKTRRSPVYHDDASHYIPQRSLFREKNVVRNDEIMRVVVNNFFSWEDADFANIELYLARRSARLGGLLLMDCTVLGPFIVFNRRVTPPRGWPAYLLGQFQT